MPGATIVVVEDDTDTRDMMQLILTTAGYNTLMLPFGKDAHLAIRRHKPDLVLLDLWLEQREAGEMVLGLMKLDPGTKHIPVIICSANIPRLHERHAQILAQVAAVVEKPFGPDELLSAVAGALERG